jgi:nucleoside-diphosphate-sugar epimerase
VRDGELKLLADGESLLPFLHVENLVDAVVLALESHTAVGRAYNVVDTHVTWRAFTDEIRGWFGVPPLPEVPRDEVPSRSYFTAHFSNERIREELGYSPRVSYREGMEEAAEHWRREPGTPHRDAE